MEKYEKDGFVAVLVSKGFGAGWSTWNDNCDALCMDKRIVEAFISGGAGLAEEIAISIYPGIYTGGAGGLEIVWVKKGSIFKISDYDGYESLEVYGDDWGSMA